jgi:hypothetical protein
MEMSTMEEKIIHDAGFALSVVSCAFVEVVR